MSNVAQTTAYAMKTLACFLLPIIPTLLFAADPPVPKFRAVDVDTKIQIGYGLAIADIDGDKKPDIALADKNQIVWYQNPTWAKHVIAENLTPRDHVCIAARDVDGDGKAEVAVGASSCVTSAPQVSLAVRSG